MSLTKPLTIIHSFSTDCVFMFHQQINCSSFHDIQLLYFIAKQFH